MVIDVHTHIFPPEIVSEREKYFHGEPAFKLLYGHPKARMATAEELIKSMDSEGVDVSVVFGFPWLKIDLCRMHNDYVLESSAKFRDRLIPLACVYPLDRAACDEIARCMKGGACGAGELAVYGECNINEAVRSYELIAGVVKENKGILLIHANEPVGHKYPGKAPQGLEFYYCIAKSAIDLPIIFAHWGGGLLFYSLLKKEVKEVFENVYFDTAASPYLYDPKIYTVACDLIGANKILFGSDYPLLKPSRYFEEFKQAGLGEKEMAQVAGLNTAHLFGLKINQK